MKKKIAAMTFGCKINQYETSCIIDNFTQHDYDVVDFSQTADVYIINSCTVTNRTDYKSRSALRKALKVKEENPNTIVVITGCYAQRNYDEIKKIGPVDLVVDNNKKEKIYDLVCALADHNLTQKQHFQNILDLDEFSELSTTNLLERSRAFVKVQDGCDYYCAYCAIPFARGHSRSRDKEKVLQQITLLVENGYKEFVLAGINLGLYGKEKSDNYFLADLLADIEKISGVELIRLSSVEPQLFTDDVLAFFKQSTKIAPHFHIPLQAGCDEILEKMNRRYTTADFSKNLENIYSIFPNAAVGIDLIVGFPGETEELFEKTFAYLTNLKFTYLHVFSYSKRPGTVATEMKGQVDGNTQKIRSKKLAELSKNKTDKYIEFLLENKMSLRGIIEHNDSEEMSTGVSDHFIRFYLDKAIQEQDFIEMEIIERYKDGVKVKEK